MEAKFEDFLNLDIRLGKILTAELREDFRRPAYVMEIDFGEEIGIKKSSAQITERYDEEALLGHHVLAILNFPDKQIKNVMSECLVLGVLSEGGVSLIRPDHDLPLGSKLA
ncbi:tRNA-binding protein [Erysipelothrix urinaevulpis]|uniref:tRNA-binding protein n=1 Tax=Erysipelothrix urinaevulpis TaxID=2683717 RepID=UPI001359E2AE|nr:tRNA-binding protein [Erysipelothrix urinaevulpis]